MRAINIVDIFAAGSGHPGGTLSIMDVAAALYLRVLNHDPQNPTWAERDCVIWSTGHKAPRSTWPWAKQATSRSMTQLCFASSDQDSKAIPTG